jgi:CBS domain-containing protein/DNA-directed RNA polymerase subunit RPC12/RpoP
MRAADVMSRRVISITAQQSRQQAARLMAQHRISGLPVVTQENELVGVVSEYDVISKQGETVGEIMSRGVISVSGETELEEVRHLLVYERIKRVPVLEGGKLVGIVSRGDLVREVAQRWECQVCGEVVHSEEQPQRCPRCGARIVGEAQEGVSPGS